MFESNQYTPLEGSKKPWWKSKIFLGVAVAVVAAVVILVIIVIAVMKVNDNKSVCPDCLGKAITGKNLIGHLKTLEGIALAYNNSRTAITGYNESVAYVVSQLTDRTPYQISIQPFTFQMFAEIQPPTFQVMEGTAVRTPVWKVDFQTLRYSGSQTLPFTPLISVNGGCMDADFHNFTAGSVALISRGFLTDCTMTVKIQNAVRYNATGCVVSYDPGTTGLFSGGLETSVPISCLAVSYAFGQALRESVLGVKVSMSTKTESPTVQTMNVLASSNFGDPNKPKIVVGSHLDSVLAGPGINDNGSGSSTNLELAIQTAALNLNFKNRILFAWWGAEEYGLLGSKFFVNSLTADQRKDIALNLNFDMLGSPNFFRGVYNGSSGAENIQVGSAKIQGVFEEFFNSANLAAEPTPFTGRSDYGPFIENGIPAGGLASGAEVIKSVDQRTKYGGYANTPFDPCYHQYCDTVENVNLNVLHELATAAAFTLTRLADQDDLVGYLSS